MHSWCLRKSEEDVRSSGTGITERCDSPCGCWELNPDPLAEQPVLLMAESSLQPQDFCYFLILFECVGLCVGICMEVQVPAEARGIRAEGYNCGYKAPDMSAEN